MISPLLTLALSLSPPFPSLSSLPPPTLKLGGGATCVDAKEVYQLEACCGAPESKVLGSTAVSYVADPTTTFALSDAQQTSCSLPVITHSQLLIDEKVFLYARADPNNGFVQAQEFLRWAYSGVGIATGTTLFSGGSFSQYATDGTRYDPTNPLSVPQNYYYHAYYVNSEAAFNVWNWTITNLVAHGLVVNGAVSKGVMAILSFGPESRVVFSGMCKRYADAFKQVLVDAKILSMSFDFVFPASSMMALPSVPVEAHVPKIKLQSAADVAKVGFVPPGWDMPM